MADLDVILRFILDQGSQQKTKSGVDQLSGDLSDVDKIARAVAKDFDDIEKKMREATTPSDFDSVERKLKDVDEQVKTVTKSYQLQAKVIRAEVAASMSDTAKAQLAQVKSLNDQLGGVSRAGLGLGLGITGGIFAAASKYVKDAKEATDVTRQWEAAQRSLESSGQRIGAVFAEQALPALQQAARLAESTSKFVQSHPDLVQAALKTGEVVAAISAVGLLVNRGVKLYTDARTLLFGSEQIAAARMQDAAATKQLIAARLQAGISGVDTPKTPDSRGLGGTLGTITLVATSVIIGAELGTILGNKIGQAIAGGKTGRAGAGNFGIGDVAVGTGMLFQTPAFLAVKALNSLGVVSDKTVGKFRENINALDKFVAGLLGANKILAVLQNTGSAAGSGGTKGGRTPKVDSETTRVSTETLDQALKIYENYKADDLALVQKHYEDRQGIIAGALAAEQAENKQYAASVSKINRSTAKSLADAANDFSQGNIKAEQDYQKNRAQIIQDGAKDVEKIQQQLQERLRQLTKDHAERVENLTASRDALGLAKENRRFDDQVTEEKRQAAQEIRERRQDIQQKLADLRSSYEQERAERQADYQARVAEIRANAVEQLAELAQQHQEELQKIREQKIARLREVDSQFLEERKRRYNQFVQQLRDLDAALLGETKLRRQYHDLMMADLDRFLTNYKNSLATIGSGTTGTTGGVAHTASGGYVGYGIRMLGEQGKEFVLSNSATRAAEQLIGGGLTQDALLSTLARGAGNTRSLTITDNSRFDGRISSSQVQSIKRQVRNELVKEMLGA